MNQPTLATRNTLTRLDNGVWVNAEESARDFIDYTDGESTEDKVYARVKDAKDRSVFSEALDQAWEDWALEYHLGSKRSNIYRGLNLEGVKTVLEVGCGCGAITRFLGEQGFRVDAIEGTMRRAEIARLRTEELENVQIISSNYHALELAENHYDLVIFTGVLEYSGAYAAKGISPEEQLKITLQHAYSALSKKGQILVAIENRTGFKYLAGASEDHLNVPNIGLLNYTEPLSGDITRGIRTWSKQQWHEILAELNFQDYEFCYPFPDYKVPEAILSEHFLANTKHPEQILGGILSRDYFAMWLPQISEPLFWQTAAQTGSLDEFANSFLIVIGQSRQRLKQVVDFDFVRFASTRRNPAYRLQVVKKCYEKFVQRVPLLAGSAPTGSTLAQTRIESEVFIDGKLLEQTWHQALAVTSSYDELALHIQAYSQWLDGLLQKGASQYVDALPQNIIVDDDDTWHLIDQEWHAMDEMNKEIILFRALFHFALNARDALADMETNASLHAAGIESTSKDFPLIQTIDDFIAWGFLQAGLNYKQHRDACMRFETEMHEQVSRPIFNADLAPMLDAPIYQWHTGQSFEAPNTSMEIRVYWSQVEGVWHLDHSISAETTFEHGLSVNLVLPEMLTTHRFLRLDPAAEVLHIYKGWLEFRGLSISITRASGAREQVYVMESMQDLLAVAKLKGMRKVSGDRLMLTSADANIVLDLAEVDWGENIAAIKLECQFDHSSDKSMLGARNMLRSEAVRSAYRVRLRQHILDRYQERITTASDKLTGLEKKIDWARQTIVSGGRLDGLLRKFGLMRTPPDL
jgi:SAM-dependent methyltransferase